MVGVNHHNMNDTNKYIALKYLATSGPLSRIELSALTGLSKMTVTAIITEYMEKGMVHECGEASSTGGRKATLLEVSPTAPLTLAIAVGREIVQVGIVNMRGEVIDSEIIPFSTLVNGDMFLTNVFYLCDAMLKHRLKNSIWGIGVSCVGPLSISEGCVLNPPDFNNIRDIPIVKALQKRYSLPVYLQNDMCVAALAETYFGNKRHFKNFLYVGISAGVGGGVILDSKLYTGANGLAGAIGHSIVERNGIRCECGQKGCLEKYCSTKAILGWAREESGNENLSWLELVNNIQFNNELAQRAIERMVEYLSMAITNFQNAYDMEGVVIGGDLYFAKQYIVDRLSEKLTSSELAWTPKRSLRIEGSSFMNTASFIGTAALVMENNLNK